MSACALLVIGVVTRSLVRGRFGSRARPALWRQFSAHECPRADQKCGTDNRRRRKCGEILQHEGYLGLCGRSLIAAYGAGKAQRPDTTGDVPAIGTVPARAQAAARRSPSRDH
jgi:hypothetical protein